jgi:hypothetical protein
MHYNNNNNNNNNNNSNLRKNNSKEKRNANMKGNTAQLCLFIIEPWLPCSNLKQNLQNTVNSL